MKEMFFNSSMPRRRVGVVGCLLHSYGEQACVLLADSKVFETSFAREQFYKSFPILIFASDKTTSLISLIYIWYLFSLKHQLRTFKKSHVKSSSMRCSECSQHCSIVRNSIALVRPGVKSLLGRSPYHSPPDVAGSP